MSVAWLRTGAQALSGSRDNTLKLWDVPTGKEIRSFAGHSGSVTRVAFSPDGRTALTSSNDKTLKLWDLSTGKEIRSFAGAFSHRSQHCLLPRMGAQRCPAAMT